MCFYVVYLQEILETLILANGRMRSGLQVAVDLGLVYGTRIGFELRSTKVYGLA
jgi:hypothetical protein